MRLYCPQVVLAAQGSYAIIGVCEIAVKDQLLKILDLEGHVVFVTTARLPSRAISSLRGGWTLKQARLQGSVILLLEQWFLPLLYLFLRSWGADVGLITPEKHPGNSRL